jgi:DnaJ-class molecular chaperone
MNHDKLPGVSQGASEAEIQKAFRVAAMEIHPDHNNQPEAAEAFIRIREARDELLKEAKLRKASSAADDSSRRTAATAATATAQAAYAAADSASASAPEPSAEELQHIQELDELAREYAQQYRFRRGKAPEEVRRHWRKIETTNRRIDGKY